MIRPGTPVRVRDNEPGSLFGAIYDCTIAHHHADIGLTIKHGSKNIVCIDIQKHSPTLAHMIMDYVTRNTEYGSIVNLGTIRQMQIDYASKTLGYTAEDVARSLETQDSNLKCAFLEVNTD